DVFGELLQLIESGETLYSLIPFAQKSNLFYTTGQNWAMPGGSEAMFRAPTTGANGSNYQISKQFMPLLISQGDATMFMPTANYVHENYGMQTVFHFRSLLTNVALSQVTIQIIL